MARYYDYSIKIYKFLGNKDYDESTPIEVGGLDTNWSVREGIGKVKDTVDITILNSMGKYYNTYHGGDGTTKAFVWEWGTFPSNASEKLKVYVNGVLTTAYTISGDTVTLSTAPSSGSANIRFSYQIIEYEDRFEVFQAKNRAVTDTVTDSIISGLINDIGTDVNSGALSLSVSGVGLIELFFNTLVFVKSYTSASDRSANVLEIIQDTLLNQLNEHNSRKVVWADSNPTLRTDGTAFPDVIYSVQYKRALDIMEELSSDAYTQDGVYYYYMSYDKSDNEYLLHFLPKKLSVSASGDSLVEGETPFSIKYDLEDEEVVNVIIYNCGVDPEGHGMEYLYFDPSLGTFNQGGGTKWEYMTSTSDIGDTIINQEFENNQSLWNTTDDGARVGNFPKSTEYPYTCSFDGRNESTLLTTGVAVIVSTDAEFTDAVRLESKGRGYAKASDRVELYGNARRKLDVSLPFESPADYLPGEVITVTSESNNLFGLRLRIMEKTTEKGIVTLHVEEDEETLN